MIQILIIGKELEYIFVLSAMFSCSDFRVQLADSIEKAWECFSSSRQATILISDYSLEDSVTGIKLVEQMLSEDLPIIGTVLISGKDIDDEEWFKFRHLHSKKKVLLYWLEKPVSNEFLMRHIDDITWSYNLAKVPREDVAERIDSDEPSVQFIYARTIHETLKRARETLGVAVEDIIQTLAGVGVSLTAKQYLSYENSLARVENMPSCSFYHLCKILELPATSLGVFEYSYRLHLQRVKKAICAGEYVLPISKHLQDQLSLLADEEQFKFQKITSN